jgi:hypothetical protein
VRTRTSTRIASKADALIDNGNAVWPIPADAARQARGNRRAVSTALAPLSIYPRYDAIPQATTIRAHWQVSSEDQSSSSIS